MTQYHTESGYPQDGHMGHPKRRTSDIKIQAIADSAVLKVLSYVVTALLIPFGGWFCSSLLDEVKDIKRQLGVYQVDKATVDLRLLALEKYRAEAEQRGRLTSEDVLRLQLEQKAMLERLDRGTPKK